MNEQRTQAYLTLIEQLLNYASEAKLQQCLTENQDLYLTVKLNVG